jgi:oxygen-independent coproporphyrinogen III oxidase
VILQLKRGSIQPGYFAAKFAVDVRERFADAWKSLTDEGYLERRAGASVIEGADGDRISLRREGLSRVDSLLQRFFLSHHRGVRYT